MNKNTGESKSGYGKPLYPEMRYCLRCCTPETRTDIEFDEMGICNMCVSAEQKMHINWKEREKELVKILEDAKKRTPDTYNCIVPISGGKDSTYQLHVLTKVFKMKVLAVTFSHNWFSEVGKYNLENSLEKFNVDHIMFTPNRELVNKLARNSLPKIGDACWTCHAGVGSFPLWVAVKFRIPLLIWGESVAEYGRGTYFNPVTRYDKDYFTKVSARFTAEQMSGDGIALRDLAMLRLPSQKEVDEAGVSGIHLGDFMFWDSERQTEFVKRVYGWREDDIECAFKRYKSAECIMAGVHDYSCFVKRGYGRGTEQASQDVRAGLMTREEGFELAKQVDATPPAKALPYYLKITGITEAEFVKTCKSLSPKKAKDLPIK
jgi:N-acetyl sugar amidotransferase